MTDHRNIVIAFDGTGQTPDLNDDGAFDTSNVDKFRKALMNKKSNPTVKIYRQGVGTQYGEGITGNAFGIRLEDKIKSAYRSLQQYLTDDKYSDNRIFIIGFSRGAYAARRFAHLLNFSGIPKNINEWGKGWDNFIDQNSNSVQLNKSGIFFDVKIEMLGLWDTVKAAPTISNIKDAFLPGNVKATYHAISIDEKRKQFDVLRFRANKKVREVWFAGVHSDVGGGYPEHGISDITLKWMITHAYNHGLEFRASTLKSLNPNAQGKQHDSLKGWPFGSITRTIKPSDLIHSTVKERLANIEAYKPNNLAETPVFVDDEFV